MPIALHVPIRRLSQDEFGQIAFDVMQHVFAIHNELGRFFDESIYKRELANRLPGVRLEEPIDVTFETFHKRYYIDVFVGEGGVFEFKAVDSLAGPHRAQLLTYLMLAGLAHGKLINTRTESVQHEFVNTLCEPTERLRFSVHKSNWTDAVLGAARLHDLMMRLLGDLGAGLGLELYEDAITHFFGGEAKVNQELPVLIGGRQVGRQRVRLIAPDVAVAITGFRRLDAFEVHARRLLGHLPLRAIAWINIHIQQVTLTTLER